MNTIPKRLPLDPVLPWLKKHTELESLEVFSVRCGSNPGKMGKMLSGRSESISFDALDKMLSIEGSRSIQDFFPEYDSDAFFDSGFVVDNSKPINIAKQCSIDGCDLRSHAHGFCNLHYRRARRGALVA